jgi:DNA-binding transcriptional LysR family regulator
LSYGLIDLKLVIAIVDCGSLTGAAERVGLATSSASTRLARLESMLRVTLFTRHARGLIATTGGETMARHARQVLVRLGQLEVDLGQYSAGVQSSSN